MRLTDEYWVTCLCGANIATVRKEFTCKCGRMIRLEWPAKVAVKAACVLLIAMCLPMGAQVAQPPATVPGAIDPRVTQDNIQSTICRSGYAKTVRPPASYTNRLKLVLMRTLDLPGKPSDFELDHRVCIECGGCPTCQNNLWMQPHPQHKWKDRLENAAHKDICSGNLTLAAGQAIFLGDWYAEYVRRYSKRKQ